MFKQVSKKLCILDVDYPEDTTEVESFIFTSCGSNVGRLPPTAEECVTYYESLGGNTTEVEMMDIATISMVGDKDFDKTEAYLGLHKAMATPPIGIQRWVAPSNGVFT